VKEGFSFILSFFHFLSCTFQTLFVFVIQIICIILLSASHYKIYIHYLQRVLNTTEILSPGATSWRNGGFMVVGRAQAAATHYGIGRVYAIGGVDGFGIRLSSVHTTT
jgi:hypothetical protein